MTQQLIDHTIDRAYDDLLATRDLDTDHLLDLIEQRARTRQQRPVKTARPRQVRIAIALIALLVGFAGAAVAASDSISLGIFDRPSNKAPSPKIDESIDTLNSALSQMPATFGTLGNLEAGSRRVALSSTAGDVQAEIVVTRTQAGGYCLSALYTLDGYANPAGGGGCVQRLGSDWLSKTTFRSGFRGRDVVYGLMPDGVKTIQVATSAGSQNAILGTNAYFWMAPGPSTRFESIQVTYTTGDQG